jgi:phosphoglycerate dehydrogenase-like enzyme
MRMSCRGAGLDVFDEEPPDEAIAESQTKAANSIVTVLSGGDPDYRAV